ncbi:methionine--tRNA ligase [Lepagella muris]|jgi:methionyl-tRNA synthetase|uniref:Methionine--tRNA ligase n=1 Tax=Lepagella muris TaxID=3032870 RepID=A0AC61RGS8_9BACT|nr:methionine--tRNA ligase [Lepagella muris]ROT04429.1 methionine--tRNA ligase [Muribaculaceae bacterium Isolate-037 (Harlan)]TGY79543.1 methionine--tRNA ligase [Lepagella muris]THG53013.1 methionine--tRNA ligase [Bacteroidales bacterium]TKC61933.1 methionine--tRNA ligase [Bacteroidales bacterium]
MDKKFKRTLITSALPYANGPVHIGHLAGVYVPADIYARYLRLKGEEVMFVGGSDEHGVPITIKAKKEGVTPQDIVDRYHNIIKDSFAELGISFDVYGRTTSETHRKTASDFFRTLYDKGEFVEKTSMQLYDEEAGEFLADRYVTGTCPHCGKDGAYGDQCEACGTSLNATDLINPKSTLSGSVPVLRETSHWYLPLDKWEPTLRKWILEDHKEWRPNVYGQCKSWLDMGLQPRAVSRDLKWGIPVPVEGAEGKVLYVWFDAPIGYISNTIDADPEGWEKWWKDPETRMLHFIGKDNIVFHCIVFPAMLMAHGGYNLPDNVPANEFLNLEDDKISTSRNWAVWLHEYLRELPGKQDVLRYVLTANAPEAKDNNFTWKDFQARNNNELVAILGNFVNRAMVLVHKYYGGVVPVAGEYTDADKAVVEEVQASVAALSDNLDHFKFREGLKDAMNIARIGNKYLADSEPWKLIKTDPERTATILNVALQICANLAVVFEPFTPFMSAKLASQLRLSSLNWDMAGRFDLVSDGMEIGKPELLFEKVEDSVVEAQVRKLQEAKEKNLLDQWKPAEVKAEVDFPTFEKMDIRVGKVLECEKVPKADKLLKFKIDDGMGGRTIVSGIAKYYNPEDLVGKEVCFIANFAPRKLKGVVSQGMILSAENPDGSLVVIGPTGEVRPGSCVG